MKKGVIVENVDDWATVCGSFTQTDKTPRALRVPRVLEITTRSALAELSGE